MGEQFLRKSSRIMFQNTASETSLIIEKPLIGWGAASFPILFALKNENTWYGHSHNLFMELSISYGLPVGIIFLRTSLL